VGGVDVGMHGRGGWGGVWARNGVVAVL